MIRVNHQNKIIELNLSYNIKPKYFPLIFVLNTPLTPYINNNITTRNYKVNQIIFKIQYIKSSKIMQN